MINPIDLSYIAGIIDGEGTIGLHRNHFGPKERYRTPSYMLRIRVKMTDELIVRWLHSICGGRFYYSKKQIGNCKSVFEWSIVGKAANKLLLELLPYLKLKKPQAEIGIEFAKTINKTTGFQGILLPEVVKIREDLRTRIVKLNHRGVLN